ncbi:MAG: recombinase RecA [Euryarchaeota archaeon]|nr:recombinase RecA [Euryarchaeota archaeon]
MSKIPEEIRHFLSQSGRVLLIRGEPGTGKTTLALEIMKNFNFGYLATRKIVEEIKREYPWIRKEMLEKMYFIEEKYNYENTDTFGQVFYLLPESMRHALNQYEKGEIEGIIIDSWHSILQELNIKAMEDKSREKVYESQSFFLKVLKLSDLNVKFIVVNEGKEEDPLSYLADGVITMHKKVEDGRIYRWLTVDKLRGEDIRKSNYIFTLKNSKFRALKSKLPGYPKKLVPFPEKPIQKTFFEDIFKFERGKSMVLDFGDFVPKQYRMTMVMNLVANFLIHDSRVIMIPPNELDMSELKFQLYLFSLGKYYRNLVYLYSGETMESFAREVDFSSAGEVKTTVEDTLKDYSSDVPPLLVIGYDRLYNYLQPKEMTQVLYRIKDVVSEKGGVMVFVGNVSDITIKRFCSSISDAYVKVMNVGGEVLMYGIKPWTRVFHLSLSNRGYPTVERREIA